MSIVSKSPNDNDICETLPKPVRFSTSLETNGERVIERLSGEIAFAIGAIMIAPPETTRVTTRRVSCDGASDIPGGAALGHPRVFLEIDEHGYVDCGYCDRRFILIGGPADGANQASLPDIASGASL